LKTSMKIEAFGSFIQGFNAPSEGTNGHSQKGKKVRHLEVPGRQMCNELLI
jgi:hypothetical protein